MAGKFFTPTAEFYIFKSIVRPTRRARGWLDSHRQIGFIRGFGFCPFRRRVCVPPAAGNASLNHQSFYLGDKMKRVLITGANRGLGLELVLQCVQRGEQVTPPLARNKS
jgi:hypothetical protein